MTIESERIEVNPDVEDNTVPAGMLDETPRISDLMRIAANALQIAPPLYASAIFGAPRTWQPPYRRFSEFSLLNPWRPLRTLKFLQNTWLPSIPLAPPTFNPPFLDDLFWQPTLILQRPDHYGSYISFPEELWFFVNGIMTNGAVAQLNAALLSELFHRPITLIQNSTSSLFTDLLQCALDKEGWRVTEPVNKAFPAIYDALKSPHKKRVVLIAHSQGTIIASVVLRLLKQITRPPVVARAPAPPEFVYADDAPVDLRDFEALDESELAKLEVYCFATCANTMTYYRPARDLRQTLPYMEHFGNGNDIVARLGMQAPEMEPWGICIEGPRFTRPGAYGHLLNEHYLYPIADAQRQGRKRGGRGTPAPFVPLDPKEAVETPRLYAYINGGAPAS